jgi:hypothetical protein
MSGWNIRKTAAILLLQEKLDEGLLSGYVQKNMLPIDFFCYKNVYKKCAIKPANSK